MSKEAAMYIGNGIAYFGFWLGLGLAIGLANFGEEQPSVSIYDKTVQAVESVINKQQESE